MRTWRTVAAAGAALSLLALAACGGSDDEDGGSTPAAASGPATGELRISGLNSDKAALDAVIKAFQAANPDVKVTATYADVDPHRDTLLTQLTSGTAPDFFEIWPGKGSNATVSKVGPAGYVEDLSDRPFADKVAEGLKPVLTVDDKLYGVAASVSALGAIFNDKALAAAGGKVPTTFTEVLDLCRLAKTKNTVAFSLGAMDGWVAQLIPYALVPQFAYAQNKELDQTDDYSTPHFANSGWTEAMAKQQQMVDAGCFQASPTGTDYNASVKAVGTGKALGMIQGNWAIQALKEAAPAGTTFSLHALPGTDDAKATKMAAAAAGTFAVNAKAKNKDNALKFMDFLGSPAGVNAFAKVNASLPGVPNDQFTLDPSLKDLDTYFSAGNTYPFPDQLWPNSEVQASLQAGVQKYLQGKGSLDDVLKEMDSNWKNGEDG